MKEWEKSMAGYSLSEQDKLKQYGNKYLLCIECYVARQFFSASEPQQRRVLEAHLKAAIRASGIIMLNPLYNLLVKYQVQLRFTLSAATGTIVNSNSLVIMDTESSSRNHKKTNMYEICLFRVVDKSWFWCYRVKSGWKVFFNGQLFKNTVISDKLAITEFFRFVGNKTLVYYASQNRIDRHRINDWVGLESSKLLSWFNLGYSAVFKVFGPANFIQTPNMKLSTIANNLFKVNNAVVIPPFSLLMSPKKRKVFQDVCDTFNVLLSFASCLDKTGQVCPLDDIYPVIDELNLELDEVSGVEEVE
jgi:hypothetical protein